VQENTAQVLARYLLQTNSLVPIPNSLVPIEKSTAKSGQHAMPLLRSIRHYSLPSTLFSIYPSHTLQPCRHCLGTTRPHFPSRIVDRCVGTNVHGRTDSVVEATGIGECGHMLNNRRHGGGGGGHGQGGL
jgi:hypothetical protein